MTNHVFVLGAQRTPIGSFQGALSHRSSPELGAHAIQAAVDQSGVDATSVDEVFMGCVVSAGVKQAPVNEAFACVPMMAMAELRIDPDKVNVYGGACAQGHPIGSTGSRLIVTLIHALRARGGKRGVASLCIGGGEATAIAIEGV